MPTPPLGGGGLQLMIIHLAIVLLVMVLMQMHTYVQALPAKTIS
jgi:hypothetical protein